MAQQSSTRGSSGARRRPTPAVGDEVRVSADTRNQFMGYEHGRGTETSREPIDGLIAAIREISSGHFLKVAAGDARRYVFDLVHTDTFDPSVSSKQNSQGVIAGRIADSPAYRQVQRALREQAGKGGSAIAILSAPPFTGLLDGWRVVRVCAERVEVKEAPE